MAIEDILLYWTIIRKRLWLILLLIASTTGTILAISYSSPPVYVASVKFRVVAPPPPNVSLFTGGYGFSEGVDSTLNSFVDVLTGGAVAGQVIEELQLPMDSSEFGSLITVEEVLPQLETKTQEQFTLIKVTATHGDPEVAANIVNTLMDVGLNQFGEMRARSKTQSKEFISSQLELTRQEHDKAQEALIDFQIENKIGELPHAISLQQELIYSLRQQADVAFAKGDMRTSTNYDQLILEQETKLQDMIRLGSEYTRLDTAVKQGESIYELLSEKLTEATLKENETLTLGFIEVSNPAGVPSSPLPQVRISLLSLGIVLSLVVGIMVAFIWNYIETRPPKPTQKFEEGSFSPVSPLSS